MRYRKFRDIELSTLGFGTMRFPLNADGSIDEHLTEQLLDMAWENGVNYYDTAWPYLGGKNEGVTAKFLAKHPRDSYYLADKMPGHQFLDPLEPEKIFEAQLKRLNTDYIDFYLLHNVNDSCLSTYTDEETGVIRYLLEQKKKGRIRYLGFSTHATLGCLKEFLAYCDEHGYEMDFVQIELNYLDWTLQKGKEKMEIFRERKLPVIVMEPQRGGKLSALGAADHAKLQALDPARSDASWSFRWNLGIPGVQLILSGMNALSQLEDNLRTFSEEKPLSAEETAALYEIAAGMMNNVPCTGCGYCVTRCPAGIDIPFMMQILNEYRYEVSMEPATLLEAKDRSAWPEACLGCGACAAMCPQHIEIPERMQELAGLIRQGIDWRKLCQERNAENPV